MKILIKAKQLLFVSLALLLLNGCSSQGTVGKVPDWVLNPEQDNQQYIFGIGEGRTLDQAKQRGLKDIASKFSISINSATLQKQSLRNGQADQLFTQKINSQVKNIEFTNFKQIKAEQVNQSYFVKVAISRAGFIKEKKSKLDRIIGNVDSILLDVKHSNKIKRLYAYNKVQAETAKAEPLLYLIAVADKSFDIVPYTQQFQKYALNEKRLLSSTIFSIQRPGKLSPIATALSDVMQTHGFQVRNSRSRSDAVIKLRGGVKYSKAFSTYNSRINFSFLVQSKKGVIYSKKSYQMNGASVSSYQTAYTNAVKEFLDVVKSRSDVYELLGFEDNKK